MHARLGVTILTALLLAGLSGLPAAAQETPPRATIRGVVQDDVTRAPIRTGAVHLLRGDATILTVVTDTLGRFAFTLPLPGTYRVRAEHIGYRPWESEHQTVNAGETITLELRVTPMPVLLEGISATARAERPLRGTEQLIQGRLLDDDTRQPIGQGAVSLLQADGKTVARVLTNEYGLFRLITPVPGTYTLRAERIGYQTAEHSRLHMMLRDTVWLDFHLSVSAVLLQPILVRASARPFGNRYAQQGMEEFYGRMSRLNERGDFLTRDSIAAYDAKNYTTTLMLQHYTSRVAQVYDGNIQLGGIGSARSCVPRYYVNGGEQLLMARLDDAYPPGSLEAVEVYTRPTIPGEYSRGFPCGVVVLWTRRSR